MSALGAKRKARKIIIHNEDDDEDTPQPTSDFDQGPALQPTFKSRPLKQSSLRKAISISDETPKRSAEDDDQDGGAPIVVRPSLGGRGASSKPKKRAAPSSKLSFGAPTQSLGAGDDDDAMVLGGEEPPIEATNGSLAAFATEKGARKRGLTKNNRLPLPSGQEEDQDRPRYSKEYLSELQSATPNTPANIESLHITDDHVEMSLDPSELEGATLVETSSTLKPTAILTDAEIQEKKDRRARRAQEPGADDFISFSDDDRGTGESYLSLLAKRQEGVISQKKEKRLVNDDNLDEDDSFFVEDGGLSLGARAERQAQKKKRADIASMIAKAEGVDDDETSDDSEAERRAAYEAAQTRAGMDGLAEEREQQKRRLARDGGQVPPKITPLPDLSVAVTNYKAKLAQKLSEVQAAKAEIERIKRERDDINRREPELQQLLNEAGERYRSLMGGTGPAPENSDTNGTVAAAKSLLNQSKPSDTPGRGLESMGTTPLRQSEQMDESA
ncbi:nineteen complex-related protein 2-domain-containing protein [Truncatella angustata]|uniref:Nineteen complex-related protein 2-domain-containing protein n=1 Tax=Truncatella angustata TaxID=152316 RepID=A0A9P9A1V2_9PEZI|nr:nineteen complex-related protein 2-domain-containing protein [Truncatella angustata]KAH6657335.1 nineteen complex-related protein 2-domain-containing protein [Truncatella angustata]KAH8202785.1 hypothetical protein TruAng_003056 [Truncatella angustata]